MLTIHCCPSCTQASILFLFFWLNVPERPLPVRLYACNANQITGIEISRSIMLTDPAPLALPPTSSRLCAYPFLFGAIGLGSGVSNWWDLDMSVELPSSHDSVCQSSDHQMPRLHLVHSFGQTTPYLCACDNLCVLYRFPVQPHFS